MTTQPTAERRAYTTEWAQAEIRVIRYGEEFKLEMRVMDDVGCHMHHTVNLDEREASSLREIWQEIT